MKNLNKVECKGASILPRLIRGRCAKAGKRSLYAMLGHLIPSAYRTHCTCPVRFFRRNSNNPSSDLGNMKQELIVVVDGDQSPAELLPPRKIPESCRVSELFGA